METPKQIRSIENLSENSLSKSDLIRVRGGDNDPTPTPPSPQDPGSDVPSPHPPRAN